MQKRKLDNSGIEVAPLALGTNVFGWTVDENTAFKLLDAFTDGGFNLIDTADTYAGWAHNGEGGQSETMIGKWLKKTGKRDKVVIATKVGKRMGAGKEGLSKKYILKEAEDSLRRLQTDHIDLYQSHADDPGTPIRETLEAYSQLISEGKVKIIGASNFSAARLAESLQTGEETGLPRYKILQPFYNIYDRKDFESELELLCRKEGLGVISYYSLASGFLTGKYRSEKDLNKSVRGGGVRNYLNTRGWRILGALDEVARKRNATPAQVSLAWLMAQATVVAPIASATTIVQLNELMKAAGLKMQTDEIDLLNQASD